MNGDMFGTLLPIIAMFAIMWFLLIRPAQKRQKQTKQMQESLKRGDKVITIGGLHGVIDAVDDTSVFLKVADGTTLQFDRQAVGRVVDASAS
ncbi:preprotein translocase subunit YajC [Sporosarcina sp. Marseille-Q4943]|uniref:preprotein translocase subunit YajC n=1 Tax=unclassified Sporosarcina TaxID=2647733 RepID=UPI00208DB81E|nr:preprotein translocase subunit YajC [Sporosarcina sp. Marseille-Q4943]